MLYNPYAEMRATLRRRDFKNRPQAAALASLLEKEILFFHIPKCAGNAVIADVYGLQNTPWFGHVGPKFYRRLLGPRRYRRCYKFTFVRDPVTRCRSGFEFVKRGGFNTTADDRRKARIGTLGFRAFVLDGLLHEMARKDTIFRPQSHFITDRSGVLAVDKVCAFERFEAELQALPFETRFGGAKRINAAPARITAPEEPETIDHIKQVYRMDYALMRTLGADTPAWAVPKKHED